MQVTDLPWLPRPTGDFREHVRRLCEADGDSEDAARRLAGCRLRTNELYSLGTAVTKLPKPDAEWTRLGILCSGTSDLLLPAIVASGLRYDTWVRTVGVGFDQVAAQALDPESTINRAACHFVLLVLDHRGLSLAPALGDFERARATVDAALSHIDSIRAGLRRASGCTVIVQTVPQVPTGLFGSLDRTVAGTQQWLIDQCNVELRRRIPASADLLLDTAALAERIGLDQWHDPVQWATGKFPFAHKMIPIYADWVARVVAAAKGKSRKCLVLDLDNTLWGGVIGDDGLQGIVLGQGSAVGEAYLSVQQAAVSLRERGVLLAVSSKNDDAVARSAFRQHPEMLLREEHITIFQANWQDKASNLIAIAKALDIGLDAMVLLDDNVAERAQVRDALPTVAVPELPDDPALYASTLLAAGYFEAVSFTAEDRRRADQYRARAAAQAELTTVVDLESYLQSLQMRAVCGSFDPICRSRVTQLINKTNQFNVTTRRYTQVQVQEFERSAALTLQVRLIDRFVDHGIVAVVICLLRGGDWWIDTWLMSCRILNRRLEQFVLGRILHAARAAGVDALIGEYVATARNDMVRDLYARLGFVPFQTTPQQTFWRLDTQSQVLEESPIELVEQAPLAGMDGLSGAGRPV